MRSFGEEEPGGGGWNHCQTGDIVILPAAGVTHRLLENVESSFLTVESYPAGKDRDICCGKADEQEKIHKIKPSVMV